MIKVLFHLKNRQLFFSSVLAPFSVQQLPSFVTRFLFSLQAAFFLASTAKGLVLHVFTLLFSENYAIHFVDLVKLYMLFILGHDQCLPLRI